MASEVQLIERIARAVPSAGAASGSDLAELRIGMGDDAAVVAAKQASEWVVSCDAFNEGIHFLADRHAAHSVGYKALARAASDLAAMGAMPRYFLLTLALPGSRTGKWLDQFLGGLATAARRLGMTLIGGDTTRSRTVFVSITVIGEIARGAGVARSGARPGDLIYVSGTLGAAQLGLLMVKKGVRLPRKPALAGQFSPLRAHLYPRIRIALAAWLAENRVASAMIDISDGLSTDLGHLCAASRVGARIWAERVPRVRIPAGLAGKLAMSPAPTKFDPLELALDGGEDYELLFTVPPRSAKRLRRAPDFAELTEIGRIERGRRVELIESDGKAKRISGAGWDPFRTNRSCDAN